MLEPLLGAVVSKWLPAQSTKIEIAWGDTTSATVGTVGEVRSERIKGPQGGPATVQGAAAQVAFQLPSLEVARTVGSRWADPEMRPWEGDSGTVSTFNWSA